MSLTSNDKEEMTWNLVSYTKVPTNRIRTYSNESTDSDSKCSTQSELSKDDRPADDDITYDIPNINDEKANMDQDDFCKDLYAKLGVQDKLHF